MTAKFDASASRPTREMFSKREQWFNYGWTSLALTGKNVIEAGYGAVGPS